MLNAIIDFIQIYSMFAINLVVFGAVATLTFTAKNKNIGVLVLCYYAAYICIDLAYLGLVPADANLNNADQSTWFLICLSLTLLVFVASVVLFLEGSNAAFLYASWLLVVMLFDGVLSILTLTGRTSVAGFLPYFSLLVYNVVQNISVLVDLLVVFIGMDHVIKRKCDGASNFIDYINSRLDSWRTMVIFSSQKGEKCKPKI